MKVYKRNGGNLHVFLNSELDGNEKSSLILSSL